MEFYNVKDTINLLNKTEAFRVALTKKYFMKVVCDFLLVIWNWNIEGRREETLPSRDT